MTALKEVKGGLGIGIGEQLFAPWLERGLELWIRGESWHAELVKKTVGMGKILACFH